ncbi:MAG: hypothetical protein A2Y62_00685 [Candidatus Fischerbacteria bacterium RBG_13_37_8]|uniref:Cytochrome C biogenesis protein n=1 Tax=Candidatus Fischerbacteria bacterium RBG_13_37_8 TaxID=1817863 RepID=A0A1F5VNJ1_9BACT|nr:MAG: hypothetical protein A2Y62_00685 [Candidatus Fischerbacteria bacterium RBG_13_37_8]
MLYKVTALWGGQEGSILFWTWVLLIYGVIIVLNRNKRLIEFLPMVNMIQLIVAGFFLSILLFSANPFKLMLEPLPDGKGLNPLLQDPGMVFHPPALYLGFVGFTVPFAFAVASLIMGRLDITWVKATRKWTLLSWFFLTIGIVLGAKWAYIELGWGGYWAWDPVENASLIPWFVATAFIHSVIIQEKRDMLRVWNIFLVVLTFFLCMLGTFITRSGIISSVHSFAESTIGSFFVVFLSFVLFFCSALFFLRLDQIKGSRRLESVISRESSFLFNNLLFVAMAFAVLWGTLFPMISELFTGKKITVAAPFFNKVLMPLSLMLLLLTGLCPIISWRRSAVMRIIKNLVFPLVVSLLVIMLLIITGVRLPGVLAFSFVSVFVVVSIIAEFYKGIRARQAMRKEHFIISLVKLIIKNKRRYLGFVIHLSIVLIFIGFIGGYFNKEEEVVLKKSESVHFGGYVLEYHNLRINSDENKTSVIADLDVYKGNQRKITLHPGKDFHVTSEQPMTEVDILSTWKEDLYVVLAGWEEDETVLLKLYFNPLVNWVWYGSLLLIIASLFLLFPDKYSMQRKKE